MYPANTLTLSQRCDNVLKKKKFFFTYLFISWLKKVKIQLLEVQLLEFHGRSDHQTKRFIVWT